MNQFFITKVRKLRESIPLSQGDPLDLTRKLLSCNRSAFTIRAVHPDEISKIIAHLKSSKSTGNANIDTYVIKIARAELTHIFNLSISQGVFPSLWKCVKVVPFHKKD